ncbi:MAG: ECF transporter S component [Defluviitaleaceae bacterium]|nr:ECF transporter S component [Defluviitaleaceae bacterium]
MSTTRKLVVTAMLLALSVLLPMAFHTIPMAGAILLPMHIPVLLTGLICGWKFGLVVGVVAPILSSTITGMPPMAIAPLMAIELGVYGTVAGIMTHFIRTRSATLDLYISLVAAMLVGRVVAGIAQVTFFFEGMMVDGVWTPMSYSFSIWTTTYFVTSLPGLVIQLAFIPSVVMALERERVIPLRYPVKATESAV